MEGWLSPSVKREIHNNRSIWNVYYYFDAPLKINKVHAKIFRVPSSLGVWFQLNLLTQCHIGRVSKDGGVKFVLVGVYMIFSAIFK